MKSMPRCKIFVHSPPVNKHTLEKEHLLGFDAAETVASLSHSSKILWNTLISMQSIPITEFSKESEKNTMALHVLQVV